MSGPVVELRPGMKRLPPDEDALRERLRWALLDAHAIACRWLGRSPVVLVRQSTLRKRERNAFDLGRDFGAYHGRLG